MRRTLLALGGVVMLATACGSSHRTTVPASAPAVSTTSPATAPPTTAAPPSPAAPTTSTTTAVDTAVVPPAITVAYVDAVLVKLNHLYGDAVRASVKAEKVTPTAARYLQAMYSKPLAIEQEQIFAQTLAGSLKNVRPVPGDRVTSVAKLVYASPSCIYAKVRTNSNAIVIHPVAAAADEFMGLAKSPVKATPRANQTPWVVFFDGFNNTPTNLPNQCPGE